MFFLFLRFFFVFATNFRPDVRIDRTQAAANSAICPNISSVVSEIRSPYTSAPSPEKINTKILSCPPPGPRPKMNRPMAAIPQKRMSSRAVP